MTFRRLGRCYLNRGESCDLGHSELLYASGQRPLGYIRQMPVDPAGTFLIPELFARFHQCYKSSMMSAAEWLESIGLAEYVQRFAENAIDLSILRDLTDQDLKELGVLLGHRRKMLRAIAELGEATSTTPPTGPKPQPPDEAERRHLTVT